MWYLSLRERGSGKKESEKKEGDRMDKGALHEEKAHVETETDKVTQSRVALTARGRGRERKRVTESERVFITVFTFPLSSFIPLY